MEAQSLWVLNDLPEQKVSPAISLVTELSPASLSICITDIAQHSSIMKNQLVCILIFHFLLLMASPTASALLTITHVSVLLSLHRCMWLSQMFLGLPVLAVCSKAEPFKQLLCQLDFEMNQVKKACMVHCTAAEGAGAELGPWFACHCWTDSKGGAGFNPPLGGFSDEVHSADSHRWEAALCSRLPTWYRWKGFNSPRNPVSSDHRVSAGFLPQCKGSHRGVCASGVHACSVF